MRQCLIDMMTEVRYKLELLQTWDEVMDSYLNLIRLHKLPLQLTKMGDTEGVWGFDVVIYDKLIPGAKTTAKIPKTFNNPISYS